MKNIKIGWWLVLLVAALQLWRGQAMLSILSGTFLYLALMNGWFGS